MRSCHRAFASLRIERTRTAFHQARQFSHANSSGSARSASSFESQAVARIEFILQDESRRTVAAKHGDTLLNVCQANGFDIEGTCGGKCCCTTCHVYLTDTLYDRLGDPGEDECDMLDKTVVSENTSIVMPNISPRSKTSRLGCQIKVTNDLDGAVIRLPVPAINKL